MEKTTLRGRHVWSAYLVSTVLFLVHKMEGRFPGSPLNTDRYPDWHREMPGLLVSHEPFDNLLNMGLTLCFQLALVCLCLWLLRRALGTLDERPGALGARVFVVLFSLFWVAFGCWETHHIQKLVGEHAYVPGSIFAVLYVLWIFLVLLPLVLHHQLWGGRGRRVIIPGGVRPVCPTP